VSNSILDQLVKGKTVENVPPELNSLKDAPADRQLNINTYTQPDLQIKNELTDNLMPFLLVK
jgi:hypothetical protein